jgi:2-polyprenyl-3-methyl-5-hydroxy-6-metoxy-1,4-benzoquinol methylase
MSEHNKFWNDKVPAKWRHVVNSMSSSKKERILTRVSNHILKKLENLDIKTCIDWGCGGGLITKVLLERYTVNIVDISKNSITSCIKYCNNKIENYYLFDDSMQIEITDKIDLIFSNEVIQHFPSIEYLNGVLDIWCIKIKPKYIAVQIKLHENTQDNTKGYYENNNYLNGLLINKKDFTKYFRDRKYVLISFETNKTEAGQELGYFIFESI